MVASTSEFGSHSKGAKNITDEPSRVSKPAQESANDTVLVSRFNAGDENAFDEIVARYRRKMFSVALSYLRNPADAEEVAQDTLIRAHRGLSRFRGDSSLSTWLHRIAFNLSRNRHKHNFCRRRHLTLSLDSNMGGADESTYSDSISSDAPGPAREAALRELSEVLDMCIGKLGVRQREMLMQRNVLTESYSEIARRLGISIGTVKSRMGRARESLRMLVAERYPDLASGSSTFGILDPVRTGGRLAVA